MLCSKCHQEKKLDEFSFRNRPKNIHHRFCKACHSKYRKKHYLENKETYIVKALKWNRKQRTILREYLYSVLAKSSCIDCGEEDIVVLDFDHLNNKRFSISLMFRHRHSLKAVKDEVEKCVVRCANCHRRKTAREFGHWKYRIQSVAEIGA